MPGTDPSAGLPRVAIVGSCLTRDNFNTRFNPHYKQWFSVGASSNQMSLISLMGEALPHPWEAPDGMDDYGRQNLKNEFEKGALARIALDRPDYLLIDLFGDVHFGVLEVDKAFFVTNNRWNVHKTQWYAEMKATGRLREINPYLHRDEYLGLWLDAVHRLRAFLDQALPNTIVAVNRGRNTDQLWVADSDLPLGLRASRPIAKIDVSVANALWRELDDLQIEALRAETIDLSDIDWGTHDEHPWGSFYVHPRPEYYPAFLGELQQLHERCTSRVNRSVPSHVESVLRAWRQKAATDTDTIAALMARLSTESEAREAAERRLRDAVAPRGERAFVSRARRLAGRLRRAVFPPTRG